jgi:selenocysteine-specific elongation factor
MSVTFHSGISEVEGKVRLLDKDKIKPGESGWAQLSLARSVAVAKGDLFVIRSSLGTLGGGEIVDTYPKRHHRFQPAVIESLKNSEEGTPEGALLATLEVSGPSEFEKVVFQCYLSEVEVKKSLGNLVEVGQVAVAGPEGARQLLLSRSHWEHMVKEMARLIQDYHSQFPLRRGIPKEAPKSRVKIPPQHFDNLLQKLAEGGTCRRRDSSEASFL